MCAISLYKKKIHDAAIKQNVLTQRLEQRRPTMAEQQHEVVLVQRIVMLGQIPHIVELLLGMHILGMHIAQHLVGEHEWLSPVHTHRMERRK